MANFQSVDENPGPEPCSVDSYKNQAPHECAKEITHTLSRGATRQKLFFVLQDHFNVFLQVI
jgi:hypothetical protein